MQKESLKYSHELNEYKNVFNRVLSGPVLSDIVASICEFSQKLNQNSVPEFIYGMLIRITQFFCGENVHFLVASHMNLIRLRIVKALKECNLEVLKIGVANDNLVQRLILVTHSNDYQVNFIKF